jgi:hypothetical protein
MQKVVFCAKKAIFYAALSAFLGRMIMGHTKEQQIQAADNKRKKQISVEIMRELRELTGEPFDKLEVYLKEEIPAGTFKVESKSVLYRKVGDVNNELKTERAFLLKEEEGELRIRLIDIAIKNDDNQDKVLRLLCFYEVKTRYFHYRKIDRNKPITKQMLMTHIENMQNQNLRFPIGSVLLTQKIVDDLNDHISYWDINNKKEIEAETISDKNDQRIIRIEQKRFSINKLGIEIDSTEKTTDLLSSLSDATEYYQSISKERLKQHQKLVIAKVSRNSPIKADFLQNMNNGNQDSDNDNLAATKLKMRATGLSLGVVAAAAIGGPAGLLLGSLFGLATALPMVYGMPLKTFQDLAEEIDREEAEEKEEQNKTTPLESNENHVS